MRKSVWLLFLFLLLGIVLGSCIGEFLGQYKYLNFLKYSKQFGINLNQPLILDLGILQVSLALLFNINISSIIGLMIGIVSYKKL